MTGFKQGSLPLAKLVDQYHRNWKTSQRYMLSGDFCLSQQQDNFYMIPLWVLWTVFLGGFFWTSSTNMQHLDSCCIQWLEWSLYLKIKAVLWVKCRYMYMFRVLLWSHIYTLSTEQKLTLLIQSGPAGRLTAGLVLPWNIFSVSNSPPTALLPHVCCRQQKLLHCPLWAKGPTGNAVWQH